jgi:peptidoglycan hydrolase-like protein with peptidoglycan-binding domain
MRLLATLFAAFLLTGIALQAQETPSTQAPPQAEGDRAVQEASPQEQGSQNEQVRSAQQALQQKGHYSGAIDGIAGPQTEAAVREFQEIQGLEVTGKLDDETLKRLGIE